jgi:hypothetical protein
VGSGIATRCHAGEGVLLVRRARRLVVAGGRCVHPCRTVVGRAGLLRALLLVELFDLIAVRVSVHGGSGTRRARTGKRVCAIVTPAVRQIGVGARKLLMSMASSPSGWDVSQSTTP